MTEKAIHAENVSVYYEQTPALSGVCIDVYEGDYLGIIGPNGGGKSTLLKSLLGLVPNISGEIEIFGEKIEKARGLIGYVPQSGDFDRRFPISVREVVLTGCLRKGLSPFHRFSEKDKLLVDGLLERVGLKALANRQISQLSGGEFQKMLIARGLAVQPRLLFLDEPTASVDAKSRQQIYELLSDLNAEMTIVMVTHDLLAVSSEVKSLACLNRKMVYHGIPRLDDSIVQTLYGCPVDLIAHGVPHRVLREHGDDCHD